ncbi:MAG: 50S ribosomal protein L23 [candidate division WWE3 bacterium GW2011_GWC1_41_7]|uniref:Large ribosomal subunit protein uL23 n=4 Tax=Katanobacteria TaxID=422282 RepID=A0A0G0X7T8_UNCKA|nr:MAG: 50S ribosomal protein L23 [candidate division WWE3 bacterium GW2011_GWB1_41_6]KKS20477.1 MAG: 50S ribosomal protein L23 [candidate division WWE3 bacterium GW2011_GWC1_41_7]KKS22258.1 MAG: 50S ribosomal protein L23 [candidate division WWE3 bacterium GW2011_GWA1_41_8]OGC56633.1 MAG: 50S ribosomal protein L23 [candidate division WWE3 bacterium RIFCSPLOWO2_01_FULL_41_9]
MRISNIINRPIVTEKSTNLTKEGKFTFDVNRSASKGAIANDINRIYGVDVVDVRTYIMPGKQRRVSRTSRETARKLWKKAVVKLKEGQTIDMFGQG